MKVSNRQAVFLDRDGVLTARADLTWKKSQLRLQNNVGEFILFLNQKNVPVFVVTNQGGVIGRKLITEDGIIALHEELASRLAAKGACVEGFYVCPHHPESGSKEHCLDCSCRKPSDGMLRAVAKEFAIDLKKSYMIGDMTADILAGERAGATTILMGTGHAGKDGRYAVRPMYTAKNMRALLALFKKHEFIR